MTGELRLDRGDQPPAGGAAATFAGQPLVLDPAYDVAGITALAAERAALEILSGIAARRSR